MRAGRCPICRAEVEPQGPHRPFCSERCALVDLEAWTSERYHVPGDAVRPHDPAADDESA